MDYREGERGSYEAILKIDDVVEATEVITVAGHASEIVIFTTSRDIVGTYSVTIDGVAGTFEVRETSGPPPHAQIPINWWILSGVIVAVILTGWFIWWAVNRDKA